MHVTEIPGFAYIIWIISSVLLKKLQSWPTDLEYTFTHLFITIEVLLKIVLHLSLLCNISLQMSTKYIHLICKTSLHVNRQNLAFILTKNVLHMFENLAFMTKGSYLLLIFYLEP